MKLAGIMTSDICFLLERGSTGVQHYRTQGKREERSVGLNYTQVCAVVNNFFST
jgi:hypothetical protein